ncbi:hypothetical protein JCM10212_005621 [Sporobolomyces blumeae]
MARSRIAQYPPSSTESQWFFTRDELDHAPSIRQGLSIPEERRLRQKMVQILWNFRNLSKCPQLVVNTAATFLQRFFMRESFQKWDHQIAAAAAFFLASKVEERPINSKNVTSMLLWIRRKQRQHGGTNLPLDWFANAFRLNEADFALPEFIKTRKDILFYEEAMLRFECFDMNVRHPHAVLGTAVKRIWHKGKGLESVEIAGDILDCAWSIANDTLAAPTCLLFRPRVIAAACLALACIILRQPLPPRPLSLSEQRTLWEYETEEGEEPEPFEEDVYWLDLFEVGSGDLQEPIDFIFETWALAEDDFVTDEASRLRKKVARILNELPPWPPS